MSPCLRNARILTWCRPVQRCATKHDLSLDSLRKQGFPWQFDGWSASTCQQKLWSTLWVTVHETAQSRSQTGARYFAEKPGACEVLFRAEGDSKAPMFSDCCKPLVIVSSAHSASLVDGDGRLSPFSIVGASCPSIGGWSLKVPACTFDPELKRLGIPSGAYEDATFPPVEATGYASEPANL